MSRGTRRAVALFTTIAATLASTAAWAAGGDTCAKATPIAALPFTDSSGNTCGLASDVNNTGPAACADLPLAYPGPDVFYELELGAGNSVAFDVTMPAGATGDLALFVIAEASCSVAGKCAASSIDVKGAGQGPERIKKATYPAGRYYVVVDSSIAVGTTGSCGAFTLGVTGSLGAVAPPSNDAGADGAVIQPDSGGAGGASSGGTSGATDGGPTSGGDASPDGATGTSSGGTGNAGGSSATSGGAGGTTSTGTGGATSSGGSTTTGGSAGKTTDGGLTGGENPDASTGSSHENSGCDCTVERGATGPSREGGLASLAAVVGIVAAARRRRR